MYLRIFVKIYVFEFWSFKSTLRKFSSFSFEIFKCFKKTNFLTIEAQKTGSFVRSGSIVSTLVSTVELKTEPEKEWEDIEAEKNEIKFQNREANV